jgi:2-dehydropantoate 2-reductase
MKFLILGAGALGGYFGGKLLRGGADVDFLVRPKRAAQLAEHGLIVKLQDGREIRTAVKIVQANQLQRTYDAILMSCKAYDLDQAMTAIAPAVGDGTAIAPVLNGIKHIETLADRFGRNHVLGGLTAVNAALLPSGDIVQSPVKVEMTAFGELSGEISDRCKALQQAFAAGGMQAGISEAILGPMWAKFVGFTANATVTTLCRSRAGGIAAAPAGAAMVEAVMDECSAVAAAAGYPPPPNIREIVKGLFSQPGSVYGPSILIDMEDGRPTEAAHTVGDMVERGRYLGVKTPVLTAALCNLQIYEARKSGS